VRFCCFGSVNISSGITYYLNIMITAFSAVFAAADVMSITAVEPGFY